MPFSASHSSVSGDLPEWLLLSPSSSEGRSGRCGTSSSATFVEVVHHVGGAQLEAGSSLACPRPPSSVHGAGTHHDGKALVEDVVISEPCHEGKASAGSSSEFQASAEPRGFMADARQVVPAQASTVAEGDGKWSAIICSGVRWPTGRRT
jgi:hypothetical protein